jgi:hypothetical protein
MNAWIGAGDRKPWFLPDTARTPRLSGYRNNAPVSTPVLSVGLSFWARGLSFLAGGLSFLAKGSSYGAASGLPCTQST